MESTQWLNIAKVERLQELQVDLDRIHQEQATLLNEVVQLTSAVAAYPLSPPTHKCTDSQVDSNIGRMDEDTALTDHATIRPPLTQSNTTPVLHSIKTTITSGRSHIHQK